jgi:undecaprenyl phosphate-alpha-L-ara4N flippase subunit ArnE
VFSLHAQARSLSANVTLALQIVVGILLNVTGQLLMKRAAISGGALEGGAQRAILSGWFIAGGVSLGVSMLAWVQVLRKLPLTIAHPITGAIFVMVPLASHVLWNEPLPMRRVLGIAIIGAGIVVVARS